MYDTSYDASFNSPWKLWYNASALCRPSCSLHTHDKITYYNMYDTPPGVEAAQDVKQLYVKRSAYRGAGCLGLLAGDDVHGVPVRHARLFQLQLGLQEAPLEQDRLIDRLIRFPCVDQERRCENTSVR